MATETYYEVLEVSVTATKEEIKQSFRLHAVAWHPDKHTFSNKKLAETKMKQLNEAYSVLRNAQSRADYDKKLRQQLSPKMEQASTPDVQPNVSGRSARANGNVQTAQQKAEQAKRRDEEVRATVESAREQARLNAEEYQEQARLEVERHRRRVEEYQEQARLEVERHRRKVEEYQEQVRLEAERHRRRIDELYGR